MVWGPKTKLSIFTSAFAADGWSFALTLGDAANNSSIAVITVLAKVAIHTLFLFIAFSFLEFSRMKQWSERPAPPEAKERK
jgi:hypothetical protein